jgi:hypothetical protein
MFGLDSPKELDCGRAALRVAIDEYIASFHPSVTAHHQRVVIEWRCLNCKAEGSAESSTERQAISLLRREHKNASPKCRMNCVSRVHRYFTGSAPVLPPRKRVCRRSEMNDQIKRMIEGDTLSFPCPDGISIYAFRSNILTNAKRYWRGTPWRVTIKTEGKTVHCSLILA